jgi:hypothetical protein
MDPATVVAIIVGVSGLFVAVLSHLKSSSCWCFKLETREIDTQKAITNINVQPSPLTSPNPSPVPSPETIKRESTV